MLDDFTECKLDFLLISSSSNSINCIDVDEPGFSCEFWLAFAVVALK